MHLNLRRKTMTLPGQDVPAAATKSRLSDTGTRGQRVTFLDASSDPRDFVRAENDSKRWPCLPER